MEGVAGTVVGTVAMVVDMGVMVVDMGVIMVGIMGAGAGEVGEAGAGRTMATATVGGGRTTRRRTMERRSSTMMMIPTKASRTGDRPEPSFIVTGDGCTTSSDRTSSSDGVSP